MKIGLVVACLDELEEFLKLNFKLLKKEEFPFSIYEYEYGKHHLFVILSGVGEISASIATQYLITKHGIELIINYGASGALKPHLQLFNVCLVKNIVDGEFDTSLIDHCEKNTHIELGFDHYLMSTHNKYYDLIKNSFSDIKEVNCLSSNKFIDKEEDKLRLANDFNCDICEMEVCGIYLAALKNKVPAIFLKGVSDSFNEGANEYESFSSKAASGVVQVLLKLLNSL